MKMYENLRKCGYLADLPEPKIEDASFSLVFCMFLGGGGGNVQGSSQEAPRRLRGGSKDRIVQIGAPPSW